MTTTDVPTAQTITPDQVHLFAPGRITAEGNSTQGCRRIFFRDYAYAPMVVTAPGIDSFQIVIYRKGETRLRRNCVTGWQEILVAPGRMSIMPAGWSSRWEWTDAISVSHLYLSNELMSDLAADAFDLDFRRLEGRDALQVDDDKLLCLASAMTEELRAPGEAAHILVDSIASAMSIHLIRHYHHHSGTAKADRTAQSLTPAQRARVQDFIHEHISRNFKLSELAREAGVSQFQFLRSFRKTFGESPHRYVLGLRARLAIKMICSTDLPLAKIACDAGFCDQAHMTRNIRLVAGTTPGALRKSQQ